MDQQQEKIPQINFSNTNQKVGRVGLGCGGVSYFYTKNDLTDDQIIDLIGVAISQGINLFDTAYIYGRNEEIFARAIQKYGRENFFICTKVPFKKRNEKDELIDLPLTKETIKEFCGKSLERLKIDKIDLLYSHRIDPNIPIELQAEAYKELIQEGKIGNYGFCEASEDSIRRAHKIHPISAVQEEYSLFTRDIEQNGVIKTCKELGIAIVCYSPLGRGLLTGGIQGWDSLEEEDGRKKLPRFQKENLEKNIALVEELKNIAINLGCTVVQLALSWIQAQGDNFFPIPGTKQEKYVISNAQSAKIQLNQQVLDQINELFPPNITQGNRYNENLMKKTNITTIKQQ